MLLLLLIMRVALVLVVFMCADGVDVIVGVVVVVVGGDGVVGDDVSCIIIGVGCCGFVVGWDVMLVLCVMCMMFVFLCC